MDPRLRMAPERRLVMTVALRQALQILQMPAVELAPWLLSEIEKNPLLDLLDPSYGSYAVESHEMPASITLQEHLLSQIREAFMDPKERQIAEQLLLQLDEKGYLEPPISEEQEPIILKLQSFDPPGIFARNLQECLLLQLRAQNLSHSLPYLLVRDYFPHLLKGRFAALKKLFNPKDIQEAVQKLSQLSFRPANAFHNEPIHTIVADLTLERLDRQWKIEIPDKIFPEFHLIEFPSKDLSEEEKISVREWTTAGKWMIRTLQRRKRILLQIGAYLAKKQSGYLDQKKNLSFLTLQQAAADLEMHPSTLSRALSGKYVNTPRGVIPLRSLISASPETVNSKELLEQLIAHEETPLTDAELAKRLQAQGIKLARRTITKYRKALKIGSNRDRPYSSRTTAPK